MPYLVVMDGSQKGRRFALAAGTTRIGRVEGNEIVIESLSVSSRHAEIAADGAGFRLRDLGSTNGTRLNGQPATEAAIFRDDQIQFGDVHLVFAGDDAPRREADETTAEADVPMSRPPVTVASAVAGQRQSVVPPAFKRKRDVRLIWVAVIVILLSLIVFAGLKFWHALFR